jgi:monoamine oxidase
VGGRSWTIRDGDRIEQPGGAVRASLSDGGYFNAGPARIPGHHSRILGVARRLDVALEPNLTANRAALLLRDAPSTDPPLALRQAIHDMRGQLSELLRRTLEAGQLDAALPAPLRDKLADFLMTYGDLGPDGRYRGSLRAGLANGRLRGPPRTPLTLAQLLAHERIGALTFDENILLQPTLLQPVGGMDAIPRALAAALKASPRLGRVVTAVHRVGDGVRVETVATGGGRAEQVLADYALITLPPPLFEGLALDIPNEARRAAARLAYGDAVKVAFDSPRFWEEQGIYGGTSYVGGDTAIVWYPSDRLGAPRGTLVGAYSHGPSAARLAALPPHRQVAAARAAVERLHPGSGRLLGPGISINWADERWSRGPWLAANDDRFEADVSLLANLDGPIRFAGGHLSETTGHWQEGAVQSAHLAIERISNDLHSERARPV